MSVFVDSAIMTSQHYKELIMDEKNQLREMASRHIKHCFEDLDEDGSGEISAAEMAGILEREELSGYLDVLGLKVEDVRVLFRLLDSDDSGRVDCQEFAEGCMRLQGPARAFDLHMLSYQVRHLLNNFVENAEAMDERTRDISSSLGVDDQHWRAIACMHVGSVFSIGQHRYS